MTRRAAAPISLGRAPREAWAPMALGALMAAAVLRGGAVAPADARWLLAGAATVALAAAVARLRRPVETDPDPAASALWLPVGWAALALVPLPVEALARWSPERARLALELAERGGEAAGWTAASVRPAATLYELARLAAGLAVFDLARRAGSRRAGVWLLPLIVVGAGEAAYALAQHLGRHVTLAAPGHYVNRNHLAGLLAMTAPLALAAAVHAARAGRPWRAAAAGAALATILAGLLVSYSRGGHLAALAGLAATAWLTAARTRPWRKIAALAAVLAFGWMAAPDELVERYRGLGDASGGDAAVERWRLWGETLELIGDYPLAGVGLGGYESAFSRYKASGAGFRDDHAHNDYLEWAAETGWPGLALALAVGGWLGLRAVRAVRVGPPAAVWAQAGALGGAAALLAQEAVDFNGRIPANALVFAWIAGLALSSAKHPPSAGR